MYQYQAYTPDKKIVEGTIDASSEDMAEACLHKAGYNRILTLKKTRPFLGLGQLRQWSSRVNKTDIIDLFQQLATLVDSRMPVTQALWLLAGQSPRATLKELVNRLGRELSGGASFSQALSWYPRLVPAHYREVIKVSERSGDLPLGLRLVAGYMEKELSLSKNLTRTLSYPAFLLAMASVVIAVIATVALPSLTRLFDSLGASLPLATRMLIAASGFISHDKFYLVGGLAWLAMLIVLYVKNPTGKRLLDSISLKLPVVGHIVILRNICRLCRNTAMLLEAGLTLPQTLNSVLGVIDNGIIKDSLNDIRQDLVKGKGLAQPMSGNRLYPRLLVDMVQIGEKTDTLQSSFTTMADFYEKKLDQRVQKLLAMVEPASIFIVGLIIALIGLAIVTPIYSIYQTLNY
jgi:type IV pilus assembly protein PilC